jgi:hypothetical protein
MKLRTKFFTVVGSLAAAGAIAAAPVSAANVQALALVGQTTTLTPVQLVGGSGSYAFNTIACATAGTIAAGLCTAGATGSYVSIACGTGTTGTVGAEAVLGGGTDATTINAGASITINYGITFVAGVGVLGGTSGSAKVVAAVDIIPTGGNCVSGVTQFTAPVVGVLAG